MKQVRFDKGQIVGRLTKTPQGFLRGDVIVTRTGIFNYRNDDGTPRRELRHPDDVMKADSLDTLKMIPLTLNHPEAGRVTADSAKSLQVGYTGEAYRVDGRHIIVPITITDAGAIREVEGGKNQLSLGYDVALELRAGRYDDQEFDARQTKMEYNHLAIVDMARAGSATAMKMDGIEAAYQQDAVDYRPNTPSTFRNDNQEIPMNLQKLTLDAGLSYDAAPEVVVAYNGQKKRADDAEAESKKMKGERDTAQGERDSVKAKCDKLEQEMPAKIRTAAKDRLELERVAESVLDEAGRKKLDELDNLGVMKAVIGAVDKNAKLDGQSEDYVRGLFSGIANGARKDALGKQRGAAAADETRIDDGRDDEDPDSRREKMMAENKDAWKKK